MRKALDEVPDSKLFSVGGTVQVVRIDATLGRLLNTAVPAGQTPVEKARTAAMVEAAKVLPEEAAEKVAANAMEDPHFGKVTDVRLIRGREDRPIWSVTVAAIDPEKTHIYDVDAVAAKVVDSRTSEASLTTSAVHEVR